MLISHSFRAAKINQPSVCTIGTFDGVHVGHQHLINSAVKTAHERQMQAVVITFFPHPRPMMKNLKGTYLTLPEEKTAHIAALGVDHLVILPFTRQTMNTTAQDFIEWMIDRCNLASLWVGYDFAFGKGREGSAEFLQAQGKLRGFEVQVFGPVYAEGEPVSSSRIRAALARGDMREVNVCLGRQFSLYAARASATAFFVHEDRALPAPGRYEVRVQGQPNVAVIHAHTPQHLSFEQPVDDLDGGDVVVRFVG